MSLYFQMKIRGEGRPIADLLRAHDAHPLAACAWAGNRVTITGEDGQMLSSVARNTTPTALAWHPQRKLLIVGWKDGALSVWRDEDPQNPITLPPSHHDGLAVLSATWSARGTYLATSSKSSSMVIFQLETTGKLSALWSTKVELPVQQSIHLQTVSTKKMGKADATVTDDELLFAFTTGVNTVGILDDGQQVSVLVAVEKNEVITSILWDAERRNLVTLTSSLMIAVHHVDVDLKVSTTLRRKISAPSRNTADVTGDVVAKMIWATNDGVVAICCGDDKIRMFSIEGEVIYLLPVAVPAVTCIASATSRKLLACGSSDGRASVFRFTGKSTSQDPDDWALLSSSTDVGKPLDAIRVLTSGDMVYVQDATAVTLHETQRKRKWTGFASAFQVATDHVLVETTSGSRCLVKVPSHIREIDLCFPQVAVWTGSSIAVYSITESTGTFSALNAVDSTSGCFALHSEGIIRVKDGRLSFENFQLQPLGQLSFTDAEGVPTLVDVQGDFLVCVTNKKMLKVARVSSRELRAIGPARPLFATDPDINITRVRINSVGKRVAIMTTVGAAARNPDSRVWVFEVETDRLSSHDFSTSHSVPVHVAWNTPAPNTNAMSDLEHILLACETRGTSHTQGTKRDGKPSPLDASNGVDQSRQDDEHRDDSDGGPSHQLVTLFAAPSGVVVHHTVPLRATSSLIGVTVPNVYVSVKTDDPDATAFRLEPRRLRDFEGMTGDGDATIRDALMRFGYNTTMGNMDEAYRAVKTIKDPTVWQNLAKMCVSTKRLDVAEVCLANMQHAVAARALREAKEEPELDTRLGILATSLGMREEAEKLFRRARRNDLITELHLATGEWDLAQKNAEQADRIRLRQVAYRFAQNAESQNNFNEAVLRYERAGCMGTDVPRLYFLHQRLDELRAKAAAVRDIDESNSDQANGQRDLLTWWAQYEERNGNVSDALAYYEKAKDLYNTVRLLTMQSPPQIDRAVDLVMKAPARQQGAAFFVGLYHEGQNNVSKALQFYSMAGASRRAIQLAKASDLHGEIVAIVLKSEDKQLALECAGWFESKGAYEKAVQLLQKGGDTQRAIDVCIRGGLYDVLNQISETLDHGADPDTFIQMAEHFLNSGHFDKAAQMLVFAKAYNEALQLCIDKNVKLTDEMAEAMTIPKSDNEEDESYRISLLKKIAKVAKEQESWHLACKKYTQAGERVKAMKMLLRAGDTEKVMFFANHSRNNEIYVLAGNYLQSQDWQHDANIYKNIVTFYTKAKAFENLASFYDACSQLQIDEYRNYDNALLTLREALKALEKGDASLTKRNHFAQRIQIVEQFVNARKMIQPGKPCLDMVQICTDLITRSRTDHPDHDLIEASIRVGDVFALLVEYYDKLGQHENAYSLMDRMRAQGIELTFFLEQPLVERICKAVGRDAKSMLATTQSHVYHPPKPKPMEDDANFQEEDI